MPEHRMCLDLPLRASTHHHTRAPLAITGKHHNTTENAGDSKTGTNMLTFCQNNIEKMLSCKAERHDFSYFPMHFRRSIYLWVFWFYAQTRSRSGSREDWAPSTASMYWQVQSSSLLVYTYNFV